MSIFKRLTGKKTGDKRQPADDPVLDETKSLTSNEQPSVPKDTTDAIPSLGIFTKEEKDVIKSILDDKPISPDKTWKKTEEIEDSKSTKKSVDDILLDESYKNALNILKGTPATTPSKDIPKAKSVETSNSKVKAKANPKATKAKSKKSTTKPTKTIKAAKPKTKKIIEETANAEDTKMSNESNSDYDNTKINLNLRTETPDIDTIKSDIPASFDERIETRSEHSSSRNDPYQHSSRRRENFASPERRTNLGEMRMDLASIVSDIENGDSMYRRAQQRVENLNNFIERAEVDFSLLDRLEPENRALKSQNLTLNSELDKRQTRIAQLNSSLEDLQRRYGDAQSELDATQSKLAQAMKNHERAERDISTINSKLSEVRLRHDRMRNDLDVENRENSNLRGRIGEITEQLEKTTTDKLNFAKQIETLKIDVSDQTESRTKMREEVSDLRHALEEAQRQNTSMRGEIGSVHEDIRGFKTQYEFNILKRDERISDLEAQIVELHDRLRVKEGQIESTTRDLSVLRRERTAQDLDRERLEQTIQQQSSQLSQTEEELVRTRRATSELDQKYQEVTSELARSVEVRQSSQPAETPDISATGRNVPKDDIALENNPYSAPQANRIAPNRQITDDIEDMLTDYKLGIRSNLG